MKSLFWALRAPGRPAEFREISEEGQGEIRHRLTKLYPTLQAPLCHDCEGHHERAEFAGYVDSDEPGPLFILRNQIVLGVRALADPGGEFRSWFARLFVESPIVIAALAEFGEDDHGRDEPRGDVLYQECTCGVPADFDTWARANTVGANNCFNYAVRDVWTSPAGGASPLQTYPYGEVAEWKAALRDNEGLIPVLDWTEVPGNAATGWHIALALKDNPTAPSADWHFLRLDGDHWTHKWACKTPQNCDFAGARIPIDAIERADLCGYDVKAYFWVDGPLRVG